MANDRLRRIRDVTDNFFFWQGLRWVPMGVAMLGYAAAYSPRVPIPPSLRVWIGLPTFALALWLSSSVLGRYYGRHFGRVRGDASRHVVRTTIKWVVVYPAIAVALLVDARIGPPVIVSGFAFAIAIEAYRQSTGGGREHYIVASLGLVAFSVLPLFGLLSPGKPILASLLGVLGFIYIVGGVLDHRELVRILTPIPEEPRVSSL
jgi:hypothetical protein